MHPAINLRSAKLPQILGGLAHSIQFLKVFAVSCLGLLALAMFALILAYNREPLVLTLSPSAEALERQAPPKPDDQVKAAIRAYVSKRYAWTPENVTTQIGLAEAFVSTSSLKAFRQTMPDIVRFATEKVVSQRVYPDEKMIVDLDKGIAFLSGDRVTSIQGFRTAAALKLELSFESGPRTKSNPWGIYVTKEKEK